VWVRITLRAKDEASGHGAEADADADALSIRRLIDALSRRRQAEDQPRIVEGGPFRLTN
jgi:hypothetical protein